MRGNFAVEVKHGDNRQACSEKISLIESADFCDVSACQHTDTYAYIPWGKVSWSCRTPLAVGSEVYEQCVVGRKHNAKTYSKQQCYGKEDDAARHAVPADDVGTWGEQEEAEYNNVQSCRNDLSYFSSVYDLTGKDAWDSHTYCHESEEEAGSCVDADFFGIHGNIIGGHSIGNG